MGYQDWNPRLKLNFVSNLPDSIEVLGDFQRIYQVAFNVLKSIIQFRKTNINIEIELEPNSDYLRFSF